MNQQETEKDKTIIYWCAQRATVLWILFPGDMKNRMEEKSRAAVQYIMRVSSLCALDGLFDHLLKDL